MTTIILSFAAGYLIHWATTRHQVAKAERLSALASAWQHGSADLSSRGEGTR
jgi:hypothetical protein